MLQYILKRLGYMLATLIKRKLLELELSSRQAAEATGVSHTTVLRALRGDSIDLDTLIKLSGWLGVKPHTLLNSMASADTHLSDQIAVMLESNRILAGEFKMAVQATIAGKVDPEIIEDIAAYAAYKINIRTKKY